ncbi:hypothetical protein POM88_012960 [Heracleum sosnowskyi]|uniref:Uncharacterized protein n=1 Tax=Heracleum sosnowskyi TaxID=360622 RepID=A0AAD8N286_9APIA|nr:hypothetical protein POM88_012960 [Heracleum sosnowskyi]
MTTKVQRNKGVGIGLASGVRTEDTSSSGKSNHDFPLGTIFFRKENGAEKFLRKENDFSDDGLPTMAGLRPLQVYIFEDGNFEISVFADFILFSTPPIDYQTSLMQVHNKALFSGNFRFELTSFLSGGTTTSVGRVVVEIGVHVAIWPYSGHYCDIVQQMIVLWSKLASLSNTLRGYYWCGSGRTKRRGRSWKISVLDTRFCASTFGGRVIMTFLWPSLSRTELDNDFLSTGRYLWGTIFLDPLIPRDYSLKASKMYPSCMTRWTLQEREWRLICIIGTHEGNTEFSYRINIRSQDRRYKQ